MSNKFRYDSDYQKESNLTRIKFGHDTSILEQELNEMQILHEKNIASLAKKINPSGFIELIQKEFNGKDILYNPVKDSKILLNHIALAPSRVMVNGYELNLTGNFSYNNKDGYILIDLGDAPKKGNREDLVYLEVWFQYLKGEDNVKKWGYQDGNNINYNIIDPRVNKETSHRVALMWNIRVKKDVNFNKYNKGFGYENITENSPIRAFTNGKLNKDNDQLIFANAGHDMFKGESFYKDYNLWIAGRPDYTMQSSNIYGKYIFGLPLFKVKRRNKQEYSIMNYNGAKSYKDDNININSSHYGDLSNNIRPDNLYYDYIVEDDLKDLRKTTNINEFNPHYYLNKNLQKLFTGDLITKKNKQTRRVQFGNTKKDYNNNYIIFRNKFNKTIQNDIGNNSNPRYTGNIEYRDSIGGYGIYLNGDNQITYDLSNFNKRDGTIDFYLQPYWHGTDEIDQTIFTIYDSNHNPVYICKKEKTKLIFQEYYDFIDETGEPVINNIEIDLNKDLLIAKNIYSIRLSWSNDRDINKFFIYINGDLKVQKEYRVPQLTPDSIEFGELNNQSKGCVLEDFTMYNVSFEQRTIKDGYDYIKNDYWPNLPVDFRKNKSLLLPSFNGISNYCTDNKHIQKNVVKKINKNSDGTFTLQSETDKKITNTPIVYDLNGQIINGTWSNLETHEATFTPDNSTINTILIQYDLFIPSGGGGHDMPNELLSAGIINKNDITNNDPLNDINFKEMSFHRIGIEEPRKVDYIEPREINGINDKAYDYSMNRENNEGFARLLYYHLNGNGTNEYEIPKNLYGYEVIGILGVNNRKIIQVTKQDDKYLIELNESIRHEEVIEFEVGLGGYTFEYETQSKTLMKNIHKTKWITIECNGVDKKYTKTCLDNDNNHGGILKANNYFKDNKVNNINEVIDQTVHNLCYVDNEIFYKGEKESSDKIRVIDYEVKSYNEPFITVEFSEKLPEGTIIEIPILVSYQPSKEDIISLWYNHTPYQGILSNSPKKIKRISDWKYFITTLSSGDLNINVNQKDINSLSNIVNRLPGGLSYAYTIDSEDIILEHLSNTLNNNNINKKLIFTEDNFCSNKYNVDTEYFGLTTDYTISKKGKGFQDGKINFKNKNFEVYLPQCINNISKYIGMASLVMDEKGQILLFIVGNLQKDPVKENKIIPQYGDLFKITNLPTTIQR
jgi:hypothetical protein